MLRRKETSSQASATDEQEGGKNVTQAAFLLALKPWKICQTCHEVLKMLQLLPHRKLGDCALNPCFDLDDSWSSNQRFAMFSPLQ
jgi:hypothetical protein